MKAVRRLYFYAVAFVSLETILWGLVSLLRSIFSPRLITDNAQLLAQALALVLVGVPIFLVHWLWAQRASAREEEEQTAGLRAVFLYGTLFSTLVASTYSLLALLDRLLFAASQLSSARAVFGGTQTWTDNIIALAMNLVIAAYFWSVLRGAWRTLPDPESFSEVRRLYRYLWLLFSLLMVVFGSQQVLRYIFYMPTQLIGGIGRETFVNGASLLLVGTPIWFFSWRTCQQALHDREEQLSLLRLGVLYFLAVIGVIIVLTAGGNLLYNIIIRLLGEPVSGPDLLYKLGGNLSLLFPFAVLWRYYGSWFFRHIESDDQAQGRRGKRRLYFYLLSAVGLTATFVGVWLLLALVIDLATGLEPLGGDVFRRQIAGALATLAAALPLWLLTWRPMQAEALDKADTGDHARRSILRRAYLYLVLFASVIGGMVAAVTLVFQLLQVMLSGETPATFLIDLLNRSQILVLFVILLLYHLSTLKRDTASTADTLEARQSAFDVLVLDHDGAFGALVKAAFARTSPAIPIRLIKASDVKPADSQAKAVVIAESLALSQPAALSDWMRAYKGASLVVPEDSASARWTRDPAQAAQFARLLAEGQELRPQRSRGLAAWMVITYIFAALFALEFLIFLFSLGVAAVTGFD